MLKRSRTMSPNGSAVSRRRATAPSRLACRAVRRPDVSMSVSRRRTLRRAFHGIVRTGSGATNGSCRTTIPTAIFAWRAMPSFRESLFPRDNIHAVPTEGLSPDQAAAAYETTLKRFYGADTLAPDRPLFDVTLLGIGEDGHTASLFPGQPALQETRRWAVAVIGAKAEARITLTYPALDSSRDVAFVVTGQEKRQVVARAQAGDRTLPAAVVRPVGRLALVHGSRRGVSRSGLMSVQTPPTEDASPPGPASSDRDGGFGMRKVDRRRASRLAPAMGIRGCRLASPGRQCRQDAQRHSAH